MNLYSLNSRLTYLSPSANQKRIWVFTVRFSIIRLEIILPVRTLFSYFTRSKQSRPFLMLDYAAPTLLFPTGTPRESGIIVPGQL
ncbi:hypothetical protein SRDD_05210 [Serratia sp. DD3]|nr:hypothetical protein SRDD_05210 [Serratia sp. DD3]